MSPTLEITDELTAFVERVSRSTRKQYHDMDLDDLTQEAWCWIFGHRREVREHEANPAYLFQSVRNHLVKYSRQWLQDVKGYDPTDDHVQYSVPQLKALLSLAFTPNYMEKGQAYDSQPKGSGHSDPSELWASVADVKVAYSKAPQKDKDLLWAALGEPGDPRQQVKYLAGIHGVTEEVLSQRIYDALARMRRTLQEGRAQ